MYRKMPRDMELPGIGLYFEGHLNPANRWVKLAVRPPWHELGSGYAIPFTSYRRGEMALGVWVAMSALVIKGIPDLSDPSIVDAVSEHLYPQSFLGFKHLSGGGSGRQPVSEPDKSALFRGTGNPPVRSEAEASDANGRFGGIKTAVGGQHRAQCH